MKRITTADIRKDSSNWGRHFIVDKMKQGRDKITNKTFVVLEVPPGADDKLALDYAKVYLQREIDGDDHE